MSVLAVSVIVFQYFQHLLFRCFLGLFDPDPNRGPFYVLCPSICDENSAKFRIFRGFGR